MWPAKSISKVIKSFSLTIRASICITIYWLCYLCSIKQFFYMKWSTAYFSIYWKSEDFAGRVDARRFKRHSLKYPCFLYLFVVKRIIFSTTPWMKLKCLCVKRQLVVWSIVFWCICIGKQLANLNESKICIHCGNFINSSIIIGSFECGKCNCSMKI